MIMLSREILMFFIFDEDSFSEFYSVSGFG